MSSRNVTLDSPIPAPPQRDDAPTGGDFQALARRVSREFNAPVGVLDPARLAWQTCVGISAELLPPASPHLVATLTTSGVSQGRVTLWRAPRAGGPVWLALPLPRPGGCDLIAMIPFATSLESDQALFGPLCPDPALRAWGQSVADQYRRTKEAHPAPRASSGAPETDQHLLIARLTRRLKISDAPDKFQSLATNALRHALNVSAVAWVPAQHNEPVVVSGEIGGFEGNAYRAILPGENSPQLHIVNHVDSPPGVGLTRFVAVAADSQGSTGWLLAANPLDGRPFAATEVEILQPVASLIATQHNNARLYADLKELLFGVIRALTAAIDAKDPYTSGHSERVARIAVRLAEELGMPANQRSDLYLMGLLHDVGKIGIDDHVLKKTGPLTPDEYRQIQAHVEIGVHILSDLKKLHHLLPGVLHHHESLDGSGYPAGLAGDQIPLEARILAVADSFDAMSSTRPYRRRMTPMQIDDILKKGAGKQWDPKIVAALFGCRMDIEAIRQKGLGESLQLVVNETLGRM